jgi:hypothetical protein
MVIGQLLRLSSPMSGGGGVLDIRHHFGCCRYVVDTRHRPQYFVCPVAAISIGFNIERVTAADNHWFILPAAEALPHYLHLRSRLCKITKSTFCY